MKERAFIDAVHRQLPSWVHRQSMTLGAMTHAGTPDYYYDSALGTNALDLWVEYKAFQQDNHFYSTIPEVALPTDLQRRWLDRRFNAGGNVLVIVGMKIKGRAHGFILGDPTQWSTRHAKEWYSPRIQPVTELAMAIQSRLSPPKK